jgi:hypothetical protein
MKCSSLHDEAKILKRDEVAVAEFAPVTDFVLSAAAFG